ncbi:ABC transporter substrate-binding protein [Nocardioides sp.]|uniref:ABC transporter substrate-binding protein n=1 Tax=Nocardioides sp. TaxID=35761 RepID=UPI0039E4BD30
MSRLSQFAGVGLSTTLALASLSACGSSSSSSSSSDDTIKIGVSLSLTGDLGPIGPIQKAGLDYAVKRVNDAGGIEVDGETKKVELIVQDNKSDSTLAGSQAREMALKDGVSAFLTGCTPTAVLPVVQVAEAQHVPVIATCNPIGVFETFSKEGFKYSWDMFFAETEQGTDIFQTFDQVESNKKVALFTDTEPDGVAQRELFKSAATEAGYDVVGDYSFAVGTTDYSSFIKDAKSKGAQLVLSQTVIPDGIALYKQIKALELKPVAALAAKAGSSGAWWDGLGDTAQGTLTTAYWAPGGMLSDDLQAALTEQLPTIPDQGIAVSSFSAAYVLLDAIAKAGSSEPSEINDAIAASDLDTPVGHIAFDPTTHVCATDLYVLQWNEGSADQVFPADATGSVPLVAPVAGLQ